jgi:hypothetical protein
MIYLDVVVTNATDLKICLEDESRPNLSIGVHGAIGNVVPMGGDLEIPDGKLVYILSETALNVYSHNLTVGGILYVGAEGTLQANGINSYGNVIGNPGKVIIPGDGRISVLEDGTFSVKDALSVNNGAPIDPATLLGTDSVSFMEKGKLRVWELANTAAVQAFFNYLTIGKLEVVIITPNSNVRPSDLAKISGISEKKQLIASASADETEAELPIPKGATITAYTNDDLNTIKTLEVNGTLIANSVAARLALVDDLTVDGELTVGDMVVFGSLPPIVSTADAARGTGHLVMGAGDFGASAGQLLKIAKVTSAAPLITGELTVPPGNTLKLTGSGTVTTPILTGNLTVEGNLVVTGAAGTMENVTVLADGKILVTGASGSLTILAGKTLNIARTDGRVNLVDEGSLVLMAAGANSGAKLTGPGKVVVCATEIVGGSADTAFWEAIEGTNAGQSITIAAGAADTPTANVTTITGTNTIVAFTAQDDGATIMQLPEPGNKLVIEQNTIIDLGGEVGTPGSPGTPDVVKGSLFLAGHPSTPGQIELADGGTAAVVKTGNTSGASVNPGPALSIGNRVFRTPVGGTLVDIKTTNSGADGEPLAQLIGTAAIITGLMGGVDIENTVIINGVVTVGQ